MDSALYVFFGRGQAAAATMHKTKLRLDLVSASYATLAWWFGGGLVVVWWWCGGGGGDHDSALS